MLDLQIVDCFVSFPLSYTSFTSNRIVLLPKKSDVCISRMFSLFFFLDADISFILVEGESQVSKGLFH